jgi:glycosyltransferase involved in cell wall biosynthesis
MNGQGAKRPHEDSPKTPPRRDVVFWYPAVNPYMAERFSALSQRHRVAFECWFNRHTNPGRAWLIPPELMTFPFRYVPEIPTPVGTVGVPISAYVQTRPRILISFHGDVAVAPSVLHRLRRGGKLVYYVERTLSTTTSRSRAKEWMKHFLIGGAAACLSPGPDADNYAASYGVPRTRIFRLEHAVDVPRFRRAHTMRRLPATLGRIRQRGIDASLLLAGDGPDRTRYEDQIRAMRLHPVQFTGFVQQGDLADVYALADAFVFPTRGDTYGLVVDEAMASGLPIISSTSAGEIASRVVEGENGYLVPLDDPDQLASAMVRLAGNSANSAGMGEASLRLMDGRTPARWAAQMEAAVEQILQWK